MSDINVKDLTTKLLEDTNERSIRSNSYRFCNLEDIQKNWEAKTIKLLITIALY
jgi:hypothetical protein